jgi:hypothetical protein
MGCGGSHFDEEELARRKYVMVAVISCVHELEHQAQSTVEHHPSALLHWLRRVLGMSVRC